MFGNRNDTNVKINTLRRGGREFNNIHYINTLNSNERQTGDQNQRKMLCTLRRAKRFRFVLISGFLTIVFLPKKRSRFLLLLPRLQFALIFGAVKVSSAGRRRFRSHATHRKLHKIEFGVQAKFIIINQAWK